jgi:methylmalonyl-CoA mutase N-terminal domain/subunit
MEGGKAMKNKSRDEELRLISQGYEEWARKNKVEELPKRWTSSGIEYKPLYTPLDVQDIDYLRDVGFPGEYPYTRGAYPLMHRGRLWITRQYAGFGTPQETNQRFKWLYAEGNTGLNIAFDLVTQMGYDSDEPEFRDEVGRVGVAIDSMEDMETMFEGLPLDKINAAFTINAVAPIILAMYQALAEKQGVPPEKLQGTIQNDNLKEYIGRGAFVYPVKATMRMTADLFEHCSKVMPKYIPVSVCGYHIRESGCNAVQEIGLAFLIATAYIQHAVDRGLEVDSFAPRLSFNFATYMNFFEEIAKYRAARRLWARIMRERFGAKDPRSWKLLYIGGSAGGTYSWTQPDNNIIRGTIESLAAIIGGCNASATHTKDEGHTIPTEETMRTALRTQQIIAYETDVPHVVDPMAGSYFIENLTNSMERAIEEFMADIEARGGIVQAIEEGHIQRLLTRQAHDEAQRIQKGEKVVVGENLFAIDGEVPSIKFHYTDPRWVEEQIERLRSLRARRDNQALQKALDKVRRAAQGTDNIMPPLIEAAKAYATLGEMAGVLREVYGEFREPVNVF